MSFKDGDAIWKRIKKRLSSYRRLNLERIYEMVKTLFSFMLVMGLLFSSILKAETVLYCQSELTAGFYKKEGSWITTQFTPNRFTIKFNDEFSKLEGLEERAFECAWAYADPQEKFLSCMSHWKNGILFNYSLATKRFIYAQTTMFGYILNGSEPDTNAIYAGECKNF